MFRIFTKMTLKKLSFFELCRMQYFQSFHFGPCKPNPSQPQSHGHRFGDFSLGDRMHRPKRKDLKKFDQNHVLSTVAQELRCHSAWHERWENWNGPVLQNPFKRFAL